MTLRSTSNARGAEPISACERSGVDAEMIKDASFVCAMHFNSEIDTSTVRNGVPRLGSTAVPDDLIELVGFDLEFVS